ncbi:MAG: hypothetical protein H0X45_09220 [Planctomycetes bacterium]|nr:hypothetical protein [Planctomycetota bacterium]
MSRPQVVSMRVRVASNPPIAATARAARSGFTLFEVAIALLITAAIASSALLVFPSGITVQRAARFRLLATAKAYQLIDAFATGWNGNSSIDLEANAPWDVPSSYINLTNDFEARMSTQGFGICPLPTRLARRLDSANDEIQRLLDEGAQLYYCTAEGAVEQDAQKLVFAVNGCAQLNAIAQFHRKRWPYYVAYPSPPQVMQHSRGYVDGDPAEVVGMPAPWHRRPGVFGLGSNDPEASHGDNYLWDACTHPEDPSFRADVMKAFYYSEDGGTTVYGCFLYLEKPLQDGPAMLAMAERSFQGALWFARKSGMADSACGGIATPATDFSRGTCPPWRQVLAMRYLAFAATCLTRWKSAAELDGTYSIPGVTLDGFATAPVAITPEKIDLWHASCLSLVDLYATSFPYDWGAPRPAERPSMMDLPLMQWDLFTPPATGIIDGSGTIGAAQWKPLSAQPITNLGTSWSYPTSTTTASALFSPASTHFNLTATFAATERCRQLVFWSVDWQAFEDFETAPSAAVDASRWPKAAPWPGAGMDEQNQGLDWIGPHQVNFRNPEKHILFLHNMDDVATGAALVEGTGSGTGTAGFDLLGNDIFYSPDRVDPLIFSGAHGADRNGNRVLDRGPMPANNRLFAQTIARINFYDPRLCGVLR